MRLFDESVEVLEVSTSSYLLTFRDGCHGYSGKQMEGVDWSE